MDKPKLIINSGKEFVLDGDIVSIGRAPDNDISFLDDSNISRYHAEIERRGGEFSIIELGSFNGTEVNGEKLEDERPLNDGDLIVFGGSSKIKVAFTERENKEEDLPSAVPEVEEEELIDVPELDTPEPAPQPAKSKIPIMLVVAALAVGLAVVFVAAAGLVLHDPRGSDL